MEPGGAPPPRRPDRRLPAVTRTRVCASGLEDLADRASARVLSTVALHKTRPPPSDAARQVALRKRRQKAGLALYGGAAQKALAKKLRQSCTTHTAAALARVGSNVDEPFYIGTAASAAPPPLPDGWPEGVRVQEAHGVRVQEAHEMNEATRLMRGYGDDMERLAHSGTEHDWTQPRVAAMRCARRRTWPRCSAHTTRAHASHNATEPWPAASRTHARTRTRGPAPRMSPRPPLCALHARRQRAWLTAVLGHFCEGAMPRTPSCAGATTCPSPSWPPKSMIVA